MSSDLSKVEEKNGIFDGPEVYSYAFRVHTGKFE